jgi:hypothetical protein
MAELRAGNPDAAGRLVELFYPELRRLATVRMRGEGTRHTWPTWHEVFPIRVSAPRHFGSGPRTFQNWYGIF